MYESSPGLGMFEARETRNMEERHRGVGGTRARCGVVGKIWLLSEALFLLIFNAKGDFQETCY